MKRTMVIIGVAVVAIFAVVVFASQDNDGSKAAKSGANKSASDVTMHDAHGLAVDRRDGAQLYIATHTGLLALSNDGKLARVGTAQDDYMGFTAHPTDPNVFYTSGHPAGGSNIGFQKSVDGGKTWQKVSDGIGGPVDFHTMTVSQVDPTIIYGWYGGKLQRSTDEGKTWELVQTDLSRVISLATSPTDKDTVYSATADGLLVSTDKGTIWKKTGLTGTVTSLVINPTDGKEMTAYSQSDGLTRSPDGGATWKPLKKYGADAPVLHLASDTKNPATIYLLNQALAIYKSTDNAVSWKKVY